MATLKYDKQAFLEAMEPGIVSYVIKQFEQKLEEKLNKIVEDTYAELKEELPEKIEAKVMQSFKEETIESEVNIIVDLRDNQSK